MQIKFWGVRGSIAVSGSKYVRTGGNTTCLELIDQGHRLILDGGTGLRSLGEQISPEETNITMLFTHAHWDHIQGIPFFSPAFNPEATIRMIGAHNLSSAIAAQMQPPIFPIRLNQIPATLNFETIAIGTPVEIGPFVVDALPVSHPNGVLAFRIQSGHRTIVFATDNELDAEIDPNLISFAADADLLIHDAQYTDAEYCGIDGPSRRGWGHSSWESAVTLAQRAGVHQLALFHHDPRREDSGVEQIERHAVARFAGSIAAREGMVLSV